MSYYVIARVKGAGASHGSGDGGGDGGGGDDGGGGGCGFSLYSNEQTSVGGFAQLSLF